jgi:myo-inositol-1-phosphate synthase
MTSAAVTSSPHSLGASIMAKIRVAIVGVGNCASSLVQGVEFYKNAKLSLQKLDQATEGLEDQGPLSVLGLAVSKLF